MLIMLSVLLPQNYIMIKNKKTDYLVLVLIHTLLVFSGIDLIPLY